MRSRFLIGTVVLVHPNKKELEMHDGHFYTLMPNHLIPAIIFNCVPYATLHFMSCTF